MEIRMLTSGWALTLIACPPRLIPMAGQYIMGYAPGDDPVLAEPLFLAEQAPGGFWAAPSAPRGWAPGTELSLRGPLGRGFRLPAEMRRLALVALDAGVERLLPLIAPALAQNAAMALFTDAPLPPLPSVLEAFPLEELPVALSWADFLALDVPLPALPELLSRLGAGDDQPLPVAGQVLVRAAMPCAGVGACGVCALPVRRGWKLACSDGPVFDLGDL